MISGIHQSTWNPTPDGNWGVKGDWHNTLFQAVDIGSSTGMSPSLKNQFRTQSAKRVFFGPWAYLPGGQYALWNDAVKS